VVKNYSSFLSSNRSFSFFYFLIIALIFYIGFSGNFATASIFVGDILVVDDSSGINDQGVVFIIFPNNGDRAILTDFGNPAQGPVGEDPRDLVMEPDGNICVIDSDAGTNGLGALFHVDASDGSRTIFSDFGDPFEGPLGDLIQGVALFSNGDLYVVDRDAPGGNGGLFRVDKVTGFRTVVTDLSNVAQGPTGDSARNVAEGPGGVIYLVTSSGSTDNQGLLFEVDPVTGFRTVISDFGNPIQGPSANPRWLAVPPVGNLVYVVNPSNVNNAVISVDTITGNRQIVSDFDDPLQGPTETNVQGVAIDGSGQILVNGNNTDVLFSIDPITGFRTISTNYDNPAQGPLGSFGLGIIIATVSTKMPMGGSSGSCALASESSDGYSIPLYLFIPAIILIVRFWRGSK
jgi:hypothetical protein